MTEILLWIVKASLVTSALVLAAAFLVALRAERRERQSQHLARALWLDAGANFIGGFGDAIYADRELEVPSDPYTRLP